MGRRPPGRSGPASSATSGEAVNALAFLPDGRTLVTGGFDGSALFWDVSGRRRDGKLAPGGAVGAGPGNGVGGLRGEDGAKAHRAVWALAADAEAVAAAAEGAAQAGARRPTGRRSPG